MDMTGDQHIAASRQAVWAALNDPEVLRRCIPGCQELIKESEDRMTAIAVIKVGPISARFQGAVTLSELDPPNGYRISGEGQGGVAGHAKGGAIVRLSDDGDGTLLSYEVSAQVGGRLAQLGGRMIDATAKSMSAAFFRQFAAELSGEATRADATHQPASGAASPQADRKLAPATPETSAPRRFRPSTFVLGALAGAIATSLLGSFGHELASSIPPGTMAAMIFALTGATGFLLGRAKD